MRQRSGKNPVKGIGFGAFKHGVQLEPVDQPGANIQSRRGLKLPGFPVERIIL